MRKLTVIIPSKTVANLVPCMRAIVRYEPAARMIVVDDGLKFKNVDDEAFVRSHSWVTTGYRPFVFSKNCNLGIRSAGDDDVVLMNDDALLETPGGFTMMQRETYDHAEYGIIMASTNVTGQPAQIRRVGDGAGLREIPHGAFVCVLIPRRTIDTIGMLDERYCIDYGVEDRDYCETCRQYDLKVGVHDGCFVDHSQLTSTFRGGANASRSFAENFKLFQKKWGQ